MNQNSDEKLDQLLRSHKPEPPPPNPREGSIIWAKISILYLNKRVQWTARKIIMGLCLGLAVVFLGRILFMSPQQSMIAEIEQSFDLDFDKDELNEVTALISFSSKDATCSGEDCVNK